MGQISESEYNKLQDECENTFNEIQSLIIPEVNSDLIYERNKFIKKYIKNKKYGDDKYNLAKLYLFESYLLKELEKRSKFAEKSEEDEDAYKRRESFNSYIKNKIDSEIADFAEDYITDLSYRVVNGDIYKIFENDSKENDKITHAIEKFAAKMKEKYSSYFDQN